MRTPVRWTAVLAGLVVLVASGAPPLSAQNTGTVRGTVLAQQTQRPLAGAQVTIPGTRLGTLTNSAGQFMIVGVPAGDRSVRVQMIGYGTAEQPVEVDAGQPATVNFQLSETAIALDELVVTGTAAAVRKKEIGNAISAVTAAEIETQPVRNTQDILQGRTAGVTVMQSSGQPGSGQTIKIRGVNSVSQDTEPLIYVDGIRITNIPAMGGGGEARVQINPLQDIPAEDIERIEVIKGASATTLYGTEASGGVIQIFTKKGVAGAPVWSAEVTTGVARQGNVTTGDFDLYTDCGGVQQGIIASGRNMGQIQEFVDPTCPASGDWFQDGLQQSYSLSVRGGTENISYFVSGNYGDAEATLAPGRSRDGGFRLNLGFSPAEELTFSFNSSYTKRNSRFVPDGNNADGFLLNVGRGAAGYYTGGKDDDCAGVEAGTLCMSNGYLFESDIQTASDHFISGFTANYNPTAALSNRLSIGWDYLTIDNEILMPFGYLREPLGALENASNRFTKLSFDYSGSLRTDFMADRLASTFSWGGQIFRDNKRYDEIDSEGFAGPGRPDLESGALRNVVEDTRVAETNAGFFLQEQLGLDDRLFVTAGLRVDGNSAFGENFGLQAYPKLSASWVISDYDFWPGTWWETLKLRAAVGESGKAPGAFDRLRTWTPRSADEGIAAFTPLDVGNPDVGPERTREIEAGFDASFFSGRLGIEATAYRALTSDALVPVTLPPSEGFTLQQTTNVGELVNRGLEFVASLGLLRTETVDWEVRSTMSFMDSEVLDLNGQEIFADNKAEFREGFPAPAYFGRKIINPDEIADPVIEDDQYLGNVFPTQLIGVGTTLRLFRSLQLDALVEHQGGHMLPNYTGYQNARRGAWPACFEVQQKLVAFERGGDANALNDVTALERARCALNGTRFVRHDSDFWVDAADFWKLRTVSLTYGIPEGLVNFARTASVTLAATNLWTWTDYKGTDPESEDFADRAGEGVFDGNGDFGRRDYYTIPAPRTFLLTFRVSF